MRDGESGVRVKGAADGQGPADGLGAPGDGGGKDTEQRDLGREGGIGERETEQRRKGAGPGNGDGC